MILADTSIWVDHLRRGDERFSSLLREGSVLSHPLVVEELACGQIINRDEILSLVQTLTPAPQATHAEFMDFVVLNGLHGTGLGVVDVHLLMSALLAKVGLWTRDHVLRKAADHLRIP